MTLTTPAVLRLFPRRRWDRALTSWPATASEGVCLRFAGEPVMNEAEFDNEDGLNTVGGTQGATGRCSLASSSGQPAGCLVLLSELSSCGRAPCGLDTAVPAATARKTDLSLAGGRGQTRHG